MGALRRPQFRANLGAIALEVPIPNPVPRTTEWLFAFARRLVGAVGGPNLLETGAMAAGAACMALALGVTVAQATLAPVIQTPAALRRAVAASGIGDPLCPDGWAADHARRLDLTEAQVTAWYLREALELEDDDVIRAAGHYLTRPEDFRGIGGAALTRNQIVLCIADGRRLTMPEGDLIPPELRAG